MKCRAVVVVLTTAVLAGCGSSGRSVTPRVPSCGHGCQATLRGSKAAEIRTARDTNIDLFRIFPSQPGTTSCAIPNGGFGRVVTGRCRTSVAYPVTHGLYLEAFVHFHESWGKDHSSSWTVIVRWPAEKVVATELHGEVSPQMRYATEYKATGNHSTAKRRSAKRV
jgi:hypothetical protein